LFVVCVQSLEKTTSDLQTTEAELVEAERIVNETRIRREAIDAEIEKIDATMRDAKHDRRRNKEEEKFVQAIDSLKRNFPGVHGRLSDLCRPTQRKYNMAVTVAAGKDMDAIVVDTKEIGFDCIRYLREQRVGVATFLPLDNLKVPSPESMERLRAQISSDSRFRLAVDVISSDSSMKKAVQYAVGNTVVCDDLESARQLCFGQQRARDNPEARIKAVTLGGAVISKAGTMTGGLTGEEDKRASRWNDQEIEKLRERREVLENERSELYETMGSPSGIRRGGSVGHASRIEELRNNLGNLKNRDQYSRSDLEYTRGQLKEQQALLNTARRQVGKIQRQLNAAERDVDKAQKVVDEAREQVKVVEDEHYDPFREATGLRDLNAYEQAIGKSRDEYNERKRAVLEYVAQLEQQKQYESGRDLDVPVKRQE
jgi:structural maintenance of chromosome 1